MTPRELLQLHAEARAAHLADEEQWPPAHLEELMRDLVAMSRGRSPMAVALRAADLADVDGEHRAARALRVAAVEMHLQAGGGMMDGEA